MSRIKTILSSSRLFSKGSKNLDGGVVDDATFNRMTASFESNKHLVDDVQFEYSAPLIFQINELKDDVDNLHTHLSESLYTNRETSFGGSISVSSHITASGNISSSGNIIADFPDTNDDALHYPLVTDGNTIEKLNDLNFNPSTGLVQVGGSLQINSTNIVLGTTGTISTTSHITAGGYISSSGAINTLSHITASGNISASGVIYGKQIQHTYHQYNTDSLNTGQYIPAPGGYVIEGTSINYYRQWIAPFNGRLRKLMIYCENDPGNARISLYADGSFVKRKTESFGAATSTNFDFDNPDGGGDSVFTAGQRIAILIDPLNIPGDVNVVCTWEYDINL